MKKIICVCLIAVLALSLAACSDGKDENASSASASRLTFSTGATVSVEEYVLKGEIYNCEFKLGTSIQEIKDAYHYGDDEYWGTVSVEPSAESDASATSTVVSEVKNNIDATPLEIYGTDPIRMITGDAKYYYHPADEAKGISFIAYFGDAYGFKISETNADDIKASIDMSPTKESVAQSDDVFFLPGQPEGLAALEYTFNDEYKLTFFFEEGKLAATTLCDIDLWMS